MTYRRTLQNYLDSNTRLETIPGCETIAPVPESPKPTPTESIAPLDVSEPLSSFDWEAESSLLFQFSPSSGSGNWFTVVG